jgi:hypothetical protein
MSNQVDYYDVQRMIEDEARKLRVDLGDEVQARRAVCEELWEAIRELRGIIRDMRETR